MKQQDLNLSGLVDVDCIKPVPKFSDDDVHVSLFFRAVKRSFDIVSCSVALVVCILPMVVIAAAIKIDSPGPVFYKQSRLGKDGMMFDLVKFRSMCVDAEVDGLKWAEVDDPRVTRVGKFLRKTRLDEIPQFAQVIMGTMSLVGPRPERPEFAEAFEHYIPGFNQRLCVRPGITGLAQVEGGYEMLPYEKVICDIEYIKTRSVLLDAKIIFRTILVVFEGKNAR